MKKFTINSQQDLYTLKEVRNHYDEITIHLNSRELKGLIRHAVKYSNSALVIGGRMIVYSSPFETYVLRRNTIDFWQVKYEVFGCLRDAVESIEVNAAEGKLVLRKKKDLYNYSGVSFGIVFSGNKEEEKQLVYSIDTIVGNEGLQNYNYEIFICGPSDYSSSSLTDKYKGVNIKYIALDIATKPRLMICEKKNRLYEQAQYSLVVISHSRIHFEKKFISHIIKYPVEMVTPSVYFNNNGVSYKYLDLSFIDNYQDLQLGAKRGTLAGENIQEDYLHWYRKRVPFIDGGLNIFNKNLIPDPPYNNYISWGEAEDVDVCNRLFQNGILIDYLPAIKCYSATCKVTGYNNQLKTIARRFRTYLHKKHIIN
ncbi:MAG TPA: hypothetical protein VF622_07390 [Segetibacter sp.]